MSFLAKVNAIWRVPLILLWTAGLATLSVALSLVDGRGVLQHCCARSWSRFILFVSRVKVDIDGLDKLDPHRGYIFVANHLSIFDHWAFLAHFPFQLRFVTKRSLFRWPFLGWHLRRAGNIAVERHRHRQTLRAFRRASESIQTGVSFIIYPEGGRTFGDAVDPFKRGSLLLARNANAPIVPVTIIGAHRRLRRGSVIINPGTFSMIVHNPIEFEQYKDLDLQSLADRVRQTIAESYRQVPQ